MWQDLSIVQLKVPIDEQLSGNCEESQLRDGSESEIARVLNRIMDVLQL